ncbi:MAG: hypothetical protein R3F53_11950 [Gammaproteobacteria bacterium]
MKFKRIPLALTMISAMLGGVATEALAETTKQAKVAELVRALGYGGGIHRYKNYVIRGEEKYRERASEAFTNAQGIIVSLREMDVSSDESAALDSLEQAVDSYQIALEAVHKLVEEDYGVGDIVSASNAELKVDDAPALASFDTLRANHEWNEVQELEFALGYGGAIHHAKNFLLRGEKKYEEEAISDFEHALELIEKIGQTDLSDAERAALEDVKKTVMDYEKGIKTAEKTALYVSKTKVKSVIGMAIHQADKKVKVDDASALAGLAVLGKKFSGPVAD